MDAIVERIQNLIDINNDRAAPLMQELGLASTAFSSWKIGRAKPSTDAIIKIAQYYNVSTDYLLLGKLPEGEPDATVLQKQFNNIFKQLDEWDQHACLGYAQGLLKAHSKTK